MSSPAISTVFPSHRILYQLALGVSQILKALILTRTIKIHTLQLLTPFLFLYMHKPNHLKTRPFKIWTFLFGFQMVLDKLAAICLDLKWSGFRILDPI